MDLKLELKSAQEKAESFYRLWQQAVGVSGFIQYQLEELKKEEEAKNKKPEEPNKLTVA